MNAHDFGVPAPDKTQQLLAIVERIRGAYANWGGWSGIPTACDDMEALLRPDGVPVAPPSITRADAIRMAEEVGMLGDVQLNGPSLVRFAELVLSTYGVEEEARKEHEAVQTLIDEGWVWDGDQWVLPRTPGVVSGEGGKAG